MVDMVGPAVVSPDVPILGRADAYLQLVGRSTGPSRPQWLAVSNAPCVVSPPLAFQWGEGEVNVHQQHVEFKHMLLPESCLRVNQLSI